MLTKQNKIINYLRSDIRNISNTGFIKFLFPESIIIDYLPEIIYGDLVFYIADKKSKEHKIYMSLNDNLIILNKSTKNTIDSKKGFLDLIQDVLKLEVPDILIKELNKFDDDDYWFTLKVWYILEEVLPFEIETYNGNTFNLFKSLFNQNYDILYSLYKESGEPYQKIFSSMMTMMTKAKNLSNEMNLSPYYKQVLESHSKYISEFKKAVFNYTQTNVTEIDFCIFLFECSTDFIKEG